MGVPSADESDTIRLSVAKTRRDLRISLALIIAGVGLSVGFYWFEIWASTSGYWASNPPSPVGFVVISTLASVGWIFVTIGVIFAVINWSLLRSRRASARAPPPPPAGAADNTK